MESVLISSRFWSSFGREVCFAVSRVVGMFSVVIRSFSSWFESSFARDVWFAFSLVVGIFSVVILIRTFLSGFGSSFGRDVWFAFSRVELETATFVFSFLDPSTVLRI